MSCWRFYPLHPRVGEWVRVVMTSDRTRRYCTTWCLSAWCARCMWCIAAVQIRYGVYIFLCMCMCNIRKDNIYLPLRVEGNVFTGVCHSVNWGVYPNMHLGRGSVYPSIHLGRGGVCWRGGVCPGGVSALGGVSAGGSCPDTTPPPHKIATDVIGTHPTGMHLCFYCFPLSLSFYCSLPMNRFLFNTFTIFNNFVAETSGGGCGARRLHERVEKISRKHHRTKPHAATKYHQ